jgi:hypothetical protein
MRRLAESGTVTIAAASAPDEVRSAFEEFLRLEAAGWKGRRGTALASHAPTADFAHAAVHALARAGAARVHSIRVGGRPVAVLVSLIAGRTAFTWKIAYDGSCARFSPGAQLMMEAADDLLSRPGVARIDSCASAHHPMIDHLWRERMRVGTLVLGPRGGGPVYRLGLAAATAETAARTVARQLGGRVRRP